MAISGRVFLLRTAAMMRLRSASESEAAPPVLTFNSAKVQAS